MHSLFRENLAYEMLLSRSAVCLAILIALSGCGISVKESGLSASARSGLVAISKEKPRTHYTSEDKQVTYWVRLDINIQGGYKAFAVEWIDPKGEVYRKEKVRPSFGTHDILVATLPIRERYPAQHPGPWKVKLYDGDKLLDQARFTIELVQPD